MKLFRWKYILPRLGIVMGVVASLYFGLDPLLRWALILGGESAVGAKVELQEVRSSLLDGQLTLGSLQIANPRSPWKNLLQADESQLKIDANALLHKRLVIEAGTIHGITWNTERTTSGALDESLDEEGLQESSEKSAWLESGKKMSADWLEEVRTRLEFDLTGQLQTPQVVRKIQTSWPAQAAEVQGRIDSLKGHSKQLQSQWKQAPKNPLRKIEHLRQMASPLQSVREEMMAVEKQLNQWPKQAEQDKRALELARAHDQQFLRDQLHLDGLDGEQLSDQLLGPLVAERLAQIVEWVQLARSLAPSKATPTANDSKRGVDVHYVHAQPRPRLHIQKLALTGKFSSDAPADDWMGTLTDASNQPQLLPRPMQLRLHGTGATPFQMQVTLDRTSDLAKDKIELACPALTLPERTVGGGTIAMKLSPGKTELQLQMTLRGDQLDGQVRLLQPAVKLTSVVTANSEVKVNNAEQTPAPRNKRMARLSQVVGRCAAGIEQLDTKIQLGGTLQQPTWKIQSNLGPQLSQGLNQALRQFLEEEALALQESIGKQSEKQLAALASQREAVREKLLASLGEQQQWIGQLTSAGGSSLTIPSLSRRFPSLNK